MHSGGGLVTLVREKDTRLDVLFAFLSALAAAGQAIRYAVIAAGIGVSAVLSGFLPTGALI